MPPSRGIGRRWIRRAPRLVDDAEHPRQAADGGREEDDDDERERDAAEDLGLSRSSSNIRTT